VIGAINNVKILLLPGLDGTGILFDRLVSALPNDLDVQIISLDSLIGTSFSEQAQSVADSLNDTEFIIVAESYSGRMGYELCHLLGERVKRVIFLASFVSSPSIISKWAHLMPIFLLRPNIFSKWLLTNIGFSGEGNTILTAHVFESLNRAKKDKLKQRLKNISKLNTPFRMLATQAVYIQAEKDHLVSERVVNIIEKLFINVSMVKLSGGHFVAQIHPNKCAQIIMREVAEINHPTN